MALLDKMVEVIQKRLTLRLIKEMDDKDQEKFEEILDDDPQKMSDFLGKIFPNFIDIVQEEVTRLKQELVDKFKDKK